jgi:hypothetical protein
MGEQGPMPRDPDFHIESATPGGRDDSLLAGVARASRLRSCQIDRHDLRLSLREADTLRNTIIAWAHGRGLFRDLLGELESRTVRVAFARKRLLTQTSRGMASAQCWAKRGSDTAAEHDPHDVQHTVEG